MFLITYDKWFKFVISSFYYPSLVYANLHVNKIQENSNIIQVIQKKKLRQK